MPRINDDRPVTPGAVRVVRGPTNSVRRKRILSMMCTPRCMYPACTAPISNPDQRMRSVPCIPFPPGQRTKGDRDTEQEMEQADDQEQVEGDRGEPKDRQSHPRSMGAQVGDHREHHRAKDQCSEQVVRLHR